MTRMFYCFTVQYCRHKANKDNGQLKCNLSYLESRFLNHNFSVNSYLASASLSRNAGCKVYKNDSVLSAHHLEITEITTYNRDLKIVNESRQKTTQGRNRRHQGWEI